MIGDMTKKVKQFYNIISRSLLRHSHNGKIYMYDIIDIKKETSRLFKSEDNT